jgi:hypothetical protein
MPVQVTCHVRAGLVGVEIIEVSGREEAQSQPGGLNRMIGKQHRPIVSGNRPALLSGLNATAAAT